MRIDAVQTASFNATIRELEAIGRPCRKSCSPSQKGETPMSRALWIALAAMLACAPQARAQGYPDRPVKVLVPLAPASAIDIVARLVGETMGAILGQNFYI